MTPSKSSSSLLASSSFFDLGDSTKPSFDDSDGSESESSDENDDDDDDQHSSLVPNNQSSSSKRTFIDLSDDDDDSDGNDQKHSSSGSRPWKKKSRVQLSDDDEDDDNDLENVPLELVASNSVASIKARSVLLARKSRDSRKRQQLFHDAQIDGDDDVEVAPDENIAIAVPGYKAISKVDPSLVSADSVSLPAVPKPAQSSQASHSSSSSQSQKSSQPPAAGSFLITITFKNPTGNCPTTQQIRVHTGTGFGKVCRKLAAKFQRQGLRLEYYDEEVGVKDTPESMDIEEEEPPAELIGTFS